MLIGSISITCIIILLVVPAVSPRIACWDSQSKPELLLKSYMTEKKLTVHERHFLHNSCFEPVFLLIIFFQGTLIEHKQILRGLTTLSPSYSLDLECPQLVPVTTKRWQGCYEMEFSGKKVGVSPGRGVSDS